MRVIWRQPQRQTAQVVAMAGLGLAVLYTMLISAADAITKIFAENYAAPQLFALSGLLVAVFCVISNRVQPQGADGAACGFGTTCPRAMIVRSLATVLGTLAFFYAFYHLPFAEVFLFIALIPLMSALASGPILRERVNRRVWIALLLGSAGLACLFPAGFGAIGPGHLVALVAAALGTVSMVASRYIGQRDSNLLAQVFYPNLALGLTMALALPFVFKPMSAPHLLWAAIYAGLLFGARWVLVASLRLLPAYVVTPLINLQFLWMVGLGIILFGEKPGAEVFTGAGMMMLAGAWLVWDQARGEGQMSVGCKTATPVPAK